MSTIRVDRITPYQSGSVAIEGLSISNLTIDGTITASIQEGYVLVGGSGNVSTLASTSSFGGGGGADITSLNSFTASQEVLNTTFADTGSNSFIGNQTISGSLLVIGDDRVASVNPGVVLIHSGSSRATFAPNSIVLIHTESVGNSNIIGFSASPTHFSIPGLANVNEPSIFTADSSSNYYQAIEFQSQGRFAQNKVSFKVPVDVSGSMTISGSTNQVGDIILTGSLTISGSSTFRNIGPTILSGSVDISGSINSDGYQLWASSTSTIPALNSTFNLNLSGSGEYGGDNYIKKTLVLGDGKVLVAGRFQSIDGHTTNDIARLNSNGTIDTSFSSPIFGYEFGEYYGYINTFVTQSDGKIVVGGTFNQVSGSNRRGLARLNANGTLDASFVTQSWGSFGEVRDITIQNDGKIVVVGYFTSGSRRINTDGTLDTSYNVSTGNNQPSYFNNDYFHSVALLPSGSEQAILIGGSFAQWGSYSDYNNLVKLNPNGTLDFGFAGTNLDIDWNSGGWSTGDKIKKIKVTDAYSPGDNGYIYIAGRFKDTRTGPNVRNAGFGRVTTEDEGFGRGAFDSGFRTYISGSDQNLPGVSVYVNDFDFYDSDKILLGGNFITFGIPGYSTTSANRFAIVSQNTGNLISGWAASGSASTYRLNTGSVDSVTILPNDNVLVGGTFTSASNPSTAREGLASFKLTGFGEVTNTADYSITADTNQLLISSSNTYFSGDITASVISGSFVGDGSGLTGVGSSLPSGILSSSVTNFTEFSQSVDTRIDNIVSGTGFATTGSNTFVGNQQITGSLRVSGSIAQNGIGEGNTFIGLGAGAVNNPTSGIYNTFIGPGAGQSNGFGNTNVAIGPDSLGNNSSGDSNIGIGNEAGRYSEGYGNAFTINNSIFIGNGTQPKSDSQTNQIVIGNYVTGNGSNTTTIGTSATTATYLRGKLILSGSVAQEVTGSLRVSGSEIITGSLSVTGSLNVSGSVNVNGSGFIILSQLSASQEYADDFDAAAGGVPLGALYRNGGMVRIRIT